MKRIVGLALVILVFWYRPALAQTDSTRTRQQQTGWGRVLDQIFNGGSTSSTAGSGLSGADVAAGLREALRIGINNGSDQASKIDGYFKNPLIRIAFPPEAQRVATTLRQIGLGSEVDKFELALNRAAEDAAKKAKPIFWKAITSMTIQDALGILRGQEDAATQYLRRTSGQELVRAFTPIVDSTLQKNNATRYYTNLVNIYNRVPLVQRVNPNLTEYATGKAVDGLFILVAQEEKKIRENPAARVTDLLRRVFGKS